MAEISPFALGPKAAERYRAYQDSSAKAFARSAGLKTTPEAISRHKAAVVGNVVRALKLERTQELEERLNHFSGVSDLRLSPESLKYGAARSRRLNLEGWQKAVAALWLARVHHASVNVYRQPEWLEAFENQMGKLKKGASHEHIHDAVAAFRVTMFKETVRPDLRHAMNPSLESLTRNFFGGYANTDQIALGEFEVKQMLDGLRKARQLNQKQGMILGKISQAKGKKLEKLRVKLKKTKREFTAVKNRNKASLINKRLLEQD